MRDQIRSIESAISDPRQGLSEELFLFASRITPLINVDLLIQDATGRTLLTWRDDEFSGCGWHVPGGIIRYKETLSDRIHACARTEVGAEISFDPIPLLVSETILAQSNRGHFVSLLHRCRLLGSPDQLKKAGTDRVSAGEWRWHDKCPPDLLDVQRQYARFF